jgi:hypothetical protein
MKKVLAVAMSVLVMHHFAYSLGGTLSSRGLSSPNSSYSSSSPYRSSSSPSLFSLSENENSNNSNSFNSFNNNNLNLLITNLSTWYALYQSWYPNEYEDYNNYKPSQSQDVENKYIGEVILILFISILLTVFIVNKMLSR